VIERLADALLYLFTGVMRVRSTKSVGFDVDETIVFLDMFMGGKLPEWVDPANTIKIKNRRGVEVLAIPHFRHIALMKTFAARGHTVVVWSAGGEEWAWYVVKTLGLENVVSATMNKFDWYVDDKDASSWLTDRIYLNPMNPLKDSNYPHDED
jgi:hypothetical protein